MQEDAIDFNVPASEDTVIARPGDIWLLGNHRLMCGDCRSKSDITALMDGQHADLCVTDPPYNVNYEGGTEEELTIQNDSMETTCSPPFSGRCSLSCSPCSSREDPTIYSMRTVKARISGLLSGKRDSRLHNAASG